MQDGRYFAAHVPLWQALFDLDFAVLLDRLLGTDVETPQPQSGTPP